MSIEDDIPNILSDKNYQASSQKFRQIKFFYSSIWISIYLSIYLCVCVYGVIWWACMQYFDQTVRHSYHEWWESYYSNILLYTYMCVWVGVWVHVCIVMYLPNLFAKGQNAT